MKFFSRRAALTTMSVGMLSGCASAGRSPFFSTIANFRRSSSPPLEPEKVISSPFASMQAWFDGSSKALLVLGEYAADDRLVWYSADRQSITTWGPFVVRLLGLDVSVRETEMAGGWSRDLRALIGKKLEKRVSFESKNQIVSMQTVSQFHLSDKGEVELLIGTKALLKVVENVTADGAHWYRNIYWIDESSGFCWQSRQLAIPTKPPLNLRTAKAPNKT